ncbi:MAG: F0F1 ATP synthase subunit A [Clostridia bacterium]|nr:F0F1 ATP synthase subunit A [Clostridia bacterium]
MTNILAASLGEKMREALLPENVKFLGMNVNPSFFTSLIIAGVLILFAVIVRVFVVPRFKDVPGKFQSILESIVLMFDKMNETESDARAFMGAYVFSAAAYIFLGTMVELIGLRPVMGDLNACLALSLFTYFLILFFGIKANGVKGGLGALKDITVPISMSFRLFGSISSGLLITELVYNYIFLSFGLPVIVGVLFTCFHALIQAYVFAILSSLFVGEAAVPSVKSKKSKKQSDETVA